MENTYKSGKKHSYGTKTKHSNNLKNKNKLGTTFDVFNIAILLLFSLLTAYPLWFCIINSFNDGMDAMKGGIYLWPRIFSINNYKAVFSDSSILKAFGISASRVLIGTPLHVFFTAMVAYPMSKNWLLGRKFYMTLGTITLFFSGGLIPTFLNIRNLGLYDNYLVYIIPGMFGFYHMLIFVSFFKGIPSSIEESAKIDGAGDFYIFVRIILPLSTPVLATIALFCGVSYWNDYFTAVIYIRNPNLIPIQTYLYRIIAQGNTAQMMDRIQAGVGSGNLISAQTVKYATMVVVIIPIICVYPFLQKYFVKGIMIGSLKG